MKCWPSTTTAKRYGRRKVSSEVAGPPKAAEGEILVWSIDGKIFAFAEADGSQKWVYQRLNPPLTVRRFVGGTLTRGAVFTGTAGGKLLALDVNNGTLGWEANVATPKGATELERIADVTSLPVVDGKQVCAVAFQGRVACFELQRGTLLWSRDFSSLAGLELDEEYLYLTDDKGSGACTRQDDRRIGLEAGQARRTLSQRSGARRRLCRHCRRRRLPAPARPRVPAPSSAASQPTAVPRCRSPMATAMR